MVHPAGGSLNGHTVRLQLPVVYLLRVDAWDESAPGVLRLPSGRLVRGRGLRQPLTAGPLPQFSLLLQSRPRPAPAWPSRWLRWPDWRLPADPAEARQALADLWQRAAEERVEVACHGTPSRIARHASAVPVRPRPPVADAVGYVRAHYNPRAVETPWQRRFVARFER